LPTIYLNRKEVTTIVSAEIMTSIMIGRLAKDVRYDEYLKQRIIHQSE